MKNTKKFVASVTCALVAFSSFSLVGTSSRIPFLGVDTVAAATGEAPTTTAAPKNQSALIAALTTGVAPASLSRQLKKGTSGLEVRLVQNLLINAGYTLTADGSFGNKTLAAVKAFQKANGLKVDGYVGPATYALLSNSGSAVALSRTIKYGYKGSDVKYVQTLLNNYGYKLTVDGSYGKKTQAAVKDFQKKNGLKVDGNISTATFAKLNVAPPAVVVNPGTPTTVIKVGKAEAFGHREGFAQAAVVMAGDRIANVYLDEYLFIPSVAAIYGTAYTQNNGTVFTQTAVANSNKAFAAFDVDAKDKDGNAVKVPAVFASKRANAAYYSANLKSIKNNTKTVDQNFSGIQNFAIGKTIKELQDIQGTFKDATGKNIAVDAVAGATLTDTYNYLDTIIKAAQNASANSGVEVATSSLSSLKLGKVEYAAHSTGISIGIAAVVDNKIVGSYLDEYLLLPATGAGSTVAGTQYTITPICDASKMPSVILSGALTGKDATPIFGSKRVNADYYSAKMKASGGATQTVTQNFDGVQAFATGKTITELQAAIAANTPATGVKFDGKVDAVTGATLADTNNYLTTILEAAKAAK